MSINPRYDKWLTFERVPTQANYETYVAATTADVLAGIIGVEMHRINLDDAQSRLREAQKEAKHDQET